VSRKERIEQTLTSSLAPLALSVVDESNRHNVPKGAESHFNVMVVSEQFSGKNRVERHRAVYGALDAELKGGLHALTLTLLSPDEQAGRDAIASPNCMGGSKTAS
jgi:BolA protein